MAGSGRNLFFHLERDHGDIHQRHKYDEEHLERISVLLWDQYHECPECGESCSGLSTVLHKELFLKCMEQHPEHYFLYLELDQKCDRAADREREGCGKECD